MTKNQLIAKLVMLGWKQLEPNTYYGKIGVITFCDNDMLLTTNGKSENIKGYETAFKLILK